MTNETAPERIWAVYNEGSESRDEAPEIFAAPSADELMSIGKCYDAPVLPYVRADALEAAQARIAELEGALTRIDEASNHYAMTPRYSEGTLRYAHKSTRNLARAALEGKGCS